LPDGMSLYAAILGDSADDSQLAWMMEGLLTAQVTSALARLGVPDHLADGPLTASELASRVGAGADALARLLAAAAVYGLVTRDGSGRHALTPTGALLRTGAPGSARSLAVGYFSLPFWESAGRLAETVRSGERVNPAAPGGIYDYYQGQPDEAVWFARAMAQVTSILVGQLEQTGFKPLGSGRIVDVGGSRGTLLAHLLNTDPLATGVLFDRAEALAEAPAFLAEAGVGDRVELAAGDFREEVPADGDVYVLSQTLHNWDDEQVRTIVGNCHRASRAGGSLLVIEYVLPPGPEPSLAHVMDLIMLMAVGGRERTSAEHEALLGSVGYALARDTPLTDVLPWRVLEFQRM
jgi:O-methyltransferase domain